MDVHKNDKNAIVLLISIFFFFDFFKRKCKGNENKSSWKKNHEKYI